MCAVVQAEIPQPCRALVRRSQKEEGVLAGVADLVLLVPNAKYHALLIEMKTPKGRQSDSQRAWQLAVAGNDDYLYVVVRSLEEFIKVIEEYLQESC